MIRFRRPSEIVLAKEAARVAPKGCRRQAEARKRDVVKAALQAAAAKAGRKA
jgi:hypothetical protein